MRYPSEFYNSLKVGQTIFYVEYGIKETTIDEICIVRSKNETKIRINKHNGGQLSHNDYIALDKETLKKELFS